MVIVKSIRIVGGASSLKKMRGLLVFTNSPEQKAFYSVDRELEYYIRRKYEERTDHLPDQVNPCMIDMPCCGWYVSSAVAVFA